MPDGEKWSREGGKKDEDAADLPEAIPIPEVEPIPPAPTGNVTASRSKKPRGSPHWTISGTEAISYGFKSIKEVFPYLIAIILCYVAAVVCFSTALSLAFSSADNAEIMENLFLVLSFIFLVVAILTQLSLMIGLGYKFGGDILLRAVRFHHLIEKKK